MNRPYSGVSYSYEAPVRGITPRDIDMSQDEARHHGEERDGGIWIDCTQPRLVELRMGENNRKRRNEGL